MVSWSYSSSVIITDNNTEHFISVVPEPPMVDEPILTDVPDDTYDVTVEWEPMEFVVVSYFYHSIQDTSCMWSVNNACSDYSVL